MTITLTLPDDEAEARRLIYALRSASHAAPHIRATLAKIIREIEQKIAVNSTSHRAR